MNILKVAEPDDFRRNRMGELYNIPEGMRFSGYEEFITKPRMCDAVIISTQQQRKIFCSTERTFSPKQMQNAPKKDINLRLLL